jgi:hypothetical protein
MKLKLRQIWASQQAMPKLLNKELANVKASYWIGRNARVLDVEFDALNQKRIALVRRFGNEDKKTKQWDIPQEKRTEFNLLFEQLLDTEVEVNITLIDLEMIADAKLSPIDLVAIEFMLKEG